MDDEEEELMGANQIIDGDNKETSDLYMGDQEEELIIFDRWYMSMLSPLKSMSISSIFIRLPVPIEPRLS